MAEASEQAYREEKLRRKIKAGNAKTEVHIDARRAYKRSQAEKLGQIDDPKLRYQASAQAFLDAKEAEYASHPTEKYCPRCWSVLRGCICTLLRPIQTRHHYINWLHYKETWRTTNTGTLLPHSCDNARTLIFGRSGDDAELDRILKDEAAHTVFLYPSPGSITIREFYEKQRSPEEGPIADWDEFIKTAPVLNVIGIDATWSLSRSMSSAVPSSIVRVHLADPPKFSVSNMRNQSSQGRITTAEAFACAMKELGETEEAVAALYENLQLRCDATLKMSGLNAKQEPVHSVANREIREAANREKKAERRAARLQAAGDQTTSSSSTEPQPASVDLQSTSSPSN